MSIFATTKFKNSSRVHITRQVKCFQQFDFVLLNNFGLSKGNMTAFLPSNLLALFAPRPAVRYLPPLDKARHQRKPWPYVGVADYLSLFEVKYSKG